MIKKFIDNNYYIFLAVAISSVIMLITYAFCGFYPFGENSILKVDLYHQYAPFHEELRQKLLTGDSLFYSWQGGLGKEFLSQIAYYTASPISIFILFFPSKYISEAILFFVFVKIILCSYCFAYYLKNSFNKNTIIVSIFAIMYAFMAFITSFYWNIMWLDSIYLFPIVALGIDRLVKNGIYKTYLISLIFCIIVNFYIAFLVCIFATLYFLIKVFSEYNVKSEFKSILDRIIKFGILSLLAGGATMFLAIPTVVALGRTQTSDTTFPSFEIYQNVYQIITAHFSGARPVVLARNEDLPNLYSGVLTMVLIPTYFFNKEIKIKERISFAVLILFMLACSIFKQLDFIIHGFHFPANLPHRYTFIYSFIILTLAYKSLINTKGIRPLAIYVTIPLYIVYIILSEYYLINVIEDISRVLSIGDIISNIVLLVAYTFIVLYYKYNSSKDNNYINKNNVLSNTFSILFAIIASCLFIGGLIYTFKSFEEGKELTNGFYILTIVSIAIILLCSFILKYSIEKINFKFSLTLALLILLFTVSGESLFNCLNGFNHSGYTNRKKYVSYIDATDNVINYIKENDTDENKFFRQEFARFTAINESTMYHYNGFSQFSSLAYGDTSKLLENLGIAATSNSYRYYDPTPLVDSMFNIKYVMSKDNEIKNQNYNLIDKFDNVYLYKNKTPLSVGFMVNDSIKDWETEQDTPFITQNNFVYKATDIKDELLTEFPVEHFRADNVDIKPKEEKQSYSYTLQDETNLDLIPTVYARAYIPKTQRTFLYVESTNSKRFKYTINGQKFDREISTGRSLIDLGVLNAGSFVDIEFSLDRKGAYETTYSKTGNFRVYAASFDTDLFENIYNELSDEMLTVTDYDSTSLNGTINAKKDGIMFTSIPYDKGFTAFIDGIETELIPIGNDGLIGISVPEGQHQISFKYRVKGFNIGLLLTILSLVGIVAYIFIDKKLLLNKKREV
ncbi:YfhO family protein [uncultured Tyzzerella sp.]|uniref:YfhO family protein n=1 Tax=uncultured Tyzzerella sp. TaxID=2321398 RepID=UPI002942CEA6|nr:YfhO family protein [uncultured Tyzzerella sp.]